MTTSERKKKYDIAYAKDKLKRVPLNFQKEQYERVKAAADEAGETVSGYIKIAIDEKMDNDLDESIVKKLAAEQKTSCEYIRWCGRYAEGIEIAEKIHPGAEKIILVEKKDDNTIDQSLLIHVLPELEPDLQKDIVESVISGEIEKAKQLLNDRK